MRILHVLDHSLPLQSGYVSRTLGILTEQRARGWETVQLTTPRQNRSTAAYEDVDGWRFYRSPAANGFMARLPVASYVAEMRQTSQRIATLVEQVAPDIIHAHSPVLNGLPAYWAAKTKKVPFVYEVRALWEDAAVEAGTDAVGSLRYRASRGLETFVLRRADGVAVLCEGVKREVQSRGIGSSPIAVIPNAVDLAQFAPSRRYDTELADKLGLRGQLVLGFIGSFYDYEGLDILLKAMPQIIKAVPDTKLLLVGGGPHEAGLRSLVGDLAISEKVVFVGRVKREEVERYYDLVDLFVYPRRKARLTDLVTPIKPLEAMAKARVVLASDCGGHRELVRDGETGVLFPAGDPAALAKCVIDIASHRERWPQLGEEARKFVEAERTWKASVANYAPIYERLLANATAR